MYAHPFTPAHALAIADDASEAIRALNHATHPADAAPGLQCPFDAYRMLAALRELADRLPQLLTQIAGFLALQLQHDLISIDGGEHDGDPLAALGSACYHLEQQAAPAAVRLARALDTAQQAIAFARYTD